VNSRFFSLSLLLSVVLMWLTPHVQAEETKRHVLIADYAKGGFTYTVDGRAPKENEGLLLALSRTRSADLNPHSDIVVLVHERAKLADVFNLIGIIIKADYAAYRVFVFDSDKRDMTELKYSAPVPFSTDGRIH